MGNMLFSLFVFLCSGELTASTTDPTWHLTPQDIMVDNKIKPTCLWGLKPTRHARVSLSVWVTTYNKLCPVVGVPSETENEWQPFVHIDIRAATHQTKIGRYGQASYLSSRYWLIHQTTLVILSYWCRNNSCSQWYRRCSDSDVGQMVKWLLYLIYPHSEKLSGKSLTKD